MAGIQNKHCCQGGHNGLFEMRSINWPCHAMFTDKITVLDRCVRLQCCGLINDNKMSGQCSGLERGRGVDKKRHRQTERERDNVYDNNLFVIFVCTGT